MTSETNTKQTQPDDTQTDDPWTPEQFARRLRLSKNLFWARLLAAWLIGCAVALHVMLTSGDVVVALLFPVGSAAYSLFRMGLDRAS